jgi:hypothetical protein
MLGVKQRDAEDALHSERAARAVLSRRDLFAASGALALGTAFSFARPLVELSPILKCMLDCQAEVLLWMFVTALCIIALGLTAPFAWGYAAEYSSAKRFRGKRVFWMVLAKRQRLDGLPCCLLNWAHVALEPVPGLGLMCRRCGWAERKAAT